MEVPSQMIKARMIQPRRQSAIFKGVKVRVIYLYNFVDSSGDLFVQLSFIVSYHSPLLSCVEYYRVPEVGCTV